MTPKEINTAFKAFLDRFSAVPGIPNVPTFLGFPNRSSMPPGKEFTVFTKILEVPKSFGTDYFAVKDGVGIWTATTLYWITYQVDFYGKVGQQRRQNVKTVFASGIGPDFFRRYANSLGGIGLIRASDSRGATETDGTSEYATRFITDFTLSVRLAAHVEQDWLEKLEIDIMGVKENAY